MNINDEIGRLKVAPKLRRPSRPFDVDEIIELLRMARARDEYRKKAASRVAASRAVLEAVRAGKLKRLPCWVCGSCKTHGHHPAYSMPLDVIWLCAKHHKEAHAIVKWSPFGYEIGGFKVSRVKAKPRRFTSKSRR